MIYLHFFFFYQKPKTEFRIIRIFRPPNGYPEPNKLTNGRTDEKIVTVISSLLINSRLCAPIKNTLCSIVL